MKIYLAVAAVVLLLALTACSAGGEIYCRSKPSAPAPVEVLPAAQEKPVK